MTNDWLAMTLDELRDIFKPQLAKGAQELFFMDIQSKTDGALTAIDLAI